LFSFHFKIIQLKQTCLSRRGSRVRVSSRPHKESASHWLSMLALLFCRTRCRNRRQYFLKMTHSLERHNWEFLWITQWRSACWKAISVSTVQAKWSGAWVFYSICVLYQMDGSWAQPIPL